MVIMGVTFVAIAVANALVYALAAGGARARISRPSTMRWLNRAGGSMLIGAGVVTAAMRR